MSSSPSREPLVLLAPGVIFLCAAFFLPAAHMLVLSGVEDGLGGDWTATVRHYAKFFVDHYHLGVAERTFRLSALITVLCLVLGFPLALVMRRSGRRVRAALIVLVIAPLMTSVVIRTFGWLVVLGRGGMLADLVEVLGLAERGPALMHTEAGIVVAMVQVLLPFMTLTVLGSLGRLDPALEEAARTMGAGFFTTVRLVVLPLAAPGIVSGSLLCFALSISSFITPTLVGGARLPVMAGEIYQQVTGSFDWGFAAAQSALLLLATLLVVVPYGALGARRRG